MFLVSLTLPLQTLLTPTLSDPNLYEQDSAHKVDSGRRTYSVLDALLNVMFTSLPTMSY